MIGYDTLYAIQDIEDDALVGVKSSRAAAGRQGAARGRDLLRDSPSLLWGAAIWSVRPDWLALLALAAGRAPPREPGASRRSEGRRRRAPPVPVEPHCGLAGFPGHAGRRPFQPLGASPCFQSKRRASTPSRSSSARAQRAPTPPTQSTSGSESQSVQVRLGELEHVDRSEGEEIGLRVFVGQRSASVASSDFSAEALAELVDRAHRHGSRGAGRPLCRPRSRGADLHRGPFPDIDSEDRQRADDPAGFARPGARRRERRARRSPASPIPAADRPARPRARSRSRPRPASAALIVRPGTAARSASSPAKARRCSATALARCAASRRPRCSRGDRPARRRARGRPAQPASSRRPGAIRSCSIRASPGRCSAISSARSAASSVARKASFLQDKLGQQIFAAGVTHRRRSAASARPALAPVRRRRACRSTLTELVEDGVLKTWIAESASARQLGIQPTGHAVARRRRRARARARAISTSSRARAAAKNCSRPSPRRCSSPS